jgi:2-succinyl-6-hydroxy-2,4-cyclohexadiene-1-carboxylate synthase
MTDRLVHRLVVDGAHFVVEEHGPPQAAPVVLLHGFTGDRTTWEPVATALARTHRVLIPDLPGHGETRVGLDPERFGMASVTDLLVAGLSRLGVSRTALLGYSMGGRLSLFVALERPELVSRLVLESASAGLASEAARAQRRAADEALAYFVLTHSREAFAERWAELPLFASQARLAPAVRERQRAQRRRCRRAGLAASLRGMGTGVQPWLGDRVSELAMPVLLITGALDAKFTRLAADLRARVRDGSHEVVAAVGHTVHLEAPGRFLEIVEPFLAHTSAREGESECRSTG